MNLQNLEKALSRHFVARFKKASEPERARMRKGFQTSLFTWQGHTILVHSKGAIFYEVIDGHFSPNLKKINRL